MAAAHWPDTAIILGSGCSAQLGVPTMVNFMDKAFERLSKDRVKVALDDKEAKNPKYAGLSVDVVRRFIQKVKGSAAYVRTDLLNIEELYGLAEMEDSLEGTEDDLPSIPQRAFNQAIFRLANDAGKEFINDKKRFKNVCIDISTITRESHNEEPLGLDNCTRYTNLIAYLALAAHRETSYPLVIQFNWDLAFDRALYLYRLANQKERIDFKEGNLSEIEKKLQDVKNRNEPHPLQLAKRSAIIAPEFPWVKYFPSESSDESKGSGDPGPKDEQTLARRLRHDFENCPLVLRPHGSINWTKATGDTGLYPYSLDPRNMVIGEERNKRLFAIIANLFYSADDDEALERSVAHMNISPPTWKKNVEQFLDQWRLMKEYLSKIRRIIFIGYSMPRSDLYFRHFLALALAENNNAPRVYVWNPAITRLGPVHDSYLDLFAPLAREGRLFGLDGYFGDPGLYDLNRVFHLAKRLDFT